MPDLQKIAKRIVKAISNRQRLEEIQEVIYSAEDVRDHHHFLSYLMEWYPNQFNLRMSEYDITRQLTELKENNDLGAEYLIGILYTGLENVTCNKVTTDIDRILSLNEGDFIFMPIKCRYNQFKSLSSYYNDFLIIDKPNWETLDLLEAGKSAPGILLYAESASQRGLGAVNFQRDTLVRGFRKPLLWCGPEDFFLQCWRYMPDMWSIRSMSHVLEN